MAKQRRQLTDLPVLIVFFVISAIGPSGPPNAVGAEAETALARAGIRKGICVVAGLPEGNRAEFVTGLATRSELLVYFQSPHIDQVTAVRKAAEAAGLLGRRVFADRGQWKNIHLADNLAGAVLVSSSAEDSIAEAELLRVLHPAGKAILSNGRIVKPFPQGTDDWRYPYHGADNNPQSADRVTRAPYLTQFVAEPKFGPSPSVTVASGGRIFRLFGHLAHQANQNAMLNTLLAYSAHNGTVLWTRPLSEGFMVLRNTVIATPDTLYLADDRSCKLLDPATGRLKSEIIPPPEKVGGTVWKWMALEGHVLCGLIGEKEFQAPMLRSEGFGLGGWPRANWPGFDYQDPKTAWGQGRTLMAVDTRTKKLVWSHREQDFIDGRAVCMKNGRIFFYCPEKSVGCLDAETGKIAWKVTEPELIKAIGPLFSETPRWTGLSPFPYVRCSQEFLFFSGPRMPRVVAVSTKDGKLAWQKDVHMIDGGSVHLLLRDEALYALGNAGADTSFSMDPATGEVLTNFLGRRGCTIATGSADSIFYRAPGGTVRLDLATGTARHIGPMRPPCYEGVIISDGAIHWGAWKCRCQLSLYGNIGLAPAGDFNFHPPIDDSRLELAPGGAKVVRELEIDPNDWPSYEGDNFRTCTTKVGIPRRVSRQWTFRPSSPGMPTAPVIAGDVVFAADRSGVVRAVDAANGKLKWKAYTGGAVFYPPAIWQGRVYVGSADGCVYAFEAATGRPLWKFRAAPAYRRIPVMGQLISTWPVAGGVVVDDGVVYAAAGIAHYDGTHVYALDAVTGKVKWHNGTSGQLSERTGGGVSLQGDLYLADGQLRFSGGNTCGLASYDLKTGRCTSRIGDQVASAFRTAFYPYYPEYDRYVLLNHTLPDGRFLNYAADYTGSVHSSLALFEPLPAGNATLPPDWRVLPRRQPPETKPVSAWDHKVRCKYSGFIVGPGVLVAAGQPAGPDADSAFLDAVNIEDGSQIWRKALPDAVVKGGLALDHEARIVVSLKDGGLLCFATDK